MGSRAHPERCASALDIVLAISHETCRLDVSSRFPVCCPGRLSMTPSPRGWRNRDASGQGCRNHNSYWNVCGAILRTRSMNLRINREETLMKTALYPYNLTQCTRPAHWLIAWCAPLFLLLALGQSAAV